MFLLKNDEHKKFRLDNNVGKLYFTNASLYDKDESIILIARNWILSTSADKYSGMYELTAVL